MFDPAGTGSLNEAERLDGWNVGDNGSRGYQSAAHFDVLRIVKTCKFSQETITTHEQALFGFYPLSFCLYPLEVTTTSFFRSTVTSTVFIPFTNTFTSQLRATSTSFNYPLGARSPQFSRQSREVN